MADMPNETVYQRAVGWHAPAQRRFLVAAAIGVAIAVASAAALAWPVAVLAGWDAFALIVMLSLRPIILRANGPETSWMATHEGDTHGRARVLVLGSCLASLGAVAFVLSLAGQETGGMRVVLISLATLTVVLSWSLVNTLFTLHYAHLHYARPQSPAVEFGAADDEGGPEYRDFAYLAFTIGMTYQVSDTALRGRPIRRAVLVQSLLSYVFGVVIIAAGINLIAGLIG